MSNSIRVLVAVAAIAGATLAVLFWQSVSRDPSRAAAPAMVSTAPSAPAAIVASPPASEPVARRVVEAPATAAPITADDVGSALTELVGRKAVESLFQTDDFARRFVATVDNLGHSHAPARLWPVYQTPGKFSVERRGETSIIAIDNSLRYTPFVLLAESLDIPRAVDLYVRLYPRLQEVYEDLGYPGRYFNDRVIEVIDQLLATPEVAEPVAVVLTEVKGPIPSVRPWVRYQYADDALETLSSGQRILLRVGVVNERRLKAKLIEIRKELMKRTRPR